MYIGYDNGGWFWQKYKGGNGDYYQQTRKPAPTKDQEVKVRIDWTADHKMTFTLNGEVVFDKEDFSGIADSLGNKIAIKAGSWGQIGSDVLLKDIHYTGQEEAVTYTVTGSVTDESGKALEGAVVTTGNLTAETDKDGKYSLQLGAGKHELTITKAGYQTATTSVTVTEGNVEAKAVKLEKTAEIETEKLSTADMDVYVAKNFPSVVKYEMKKGDLNGKTFYGQTSAINTVRINGTDVKLSKGDVKATIKGDKATYEMTVKNEEKHIDAVLTAELTAKERNELIRKNPAYGRIVCRCEMISEGEILDSIHRPLGATTMDGIKRRTRAGMGRCQAGFCTPKTMEILERELKIRQEEITKNGAASEMIVGRNKNGKI